jgi:hypothetical protein
LHQTRNNIRPGLPEIYDYSKKIKLGEGKRRRNKQQSNA